MADAALRTPGLGVSNGSILRVETVTRRQPEARAGQVVRADRTTPRTQPRRQLGGLTRGDLRPVRGLRGIGNPVRDGWRGHGDILLPATSLITGSGVPCFRPPQLRNSASTSPRRYRGFPASVRTSGSRPRRAQVATAAEVTRNRNATCLRVIRSSSIWSPAMAAAADPGRPDMARMRSGCRRHHVHRVPLVSQTELIRDAIGHRARLRPGLDPGKYGTARAWVAKKVLLQVAARNIRQLTDIEPARDIRLRRARAGCRGWVRRCVPPASLTPPAPPGRPEPAPAPAGNDIDGPSMSLEQQRWPIDVVSGGPGACRDRGWRYPRDWRGRRGARGRHRGRRSTGG
jgi:hypothetical protein